jgi:hypothetical protein
MTTDNLPVNFGSGASGRAPNDNHQWTSSLTSQLETGIRIVVNPVVSFGKDPVRRIDRVLPILSHDSAWIPDRQTDQRAGRQCFREITLHQKILVWSAELSSAPARSATMMKSSMSGSTASRIELNIRPEKGFISGVMIFDRNRVQTAWPSDDRGIVLK